MRAYQAARREARGERVRFTVNDTVFTCLGKVTALDVSDMASIADEPADSPKAAAFFAQFYRAALGSEYPRFREAVRELDLEPEDEGDLLLDIFRDLITDLTGRPTPPSSSSPATPSRNGSTSTADSSPAEGYRVPEGFVLQPLPPESWSPTPTSP